MFRSSSNSCTYLATASARVRLVRSTMIALSALTKTRDWQNSESLGPVERAVLAATDDVVRDGVISEENWAGCQKAFNSDHAVLVELVGAIANWRLFSILLRSLNIPLESGTDGWPPDGRAPQGCD